MIITEYNYQNTFCVEGGKCQATKGSLDAMYIMKPAALICVEVLVKRLCSLWNVDQQVTDCLPDWCRVQ